MPGKFATRASRKAPATSPSPSRSLDAPTHSSTGGAAHAGADAEIAYRVPEEIARDLARDPLVGTARLLVEGGFASVEDLLTRYDEVGWQVRKVAEEVLAEPKLAGAAEVVAPLAPRRPLRTARVIADAATRAGGPGAAVRQQAFGGRVPEQGGPLTLAQTINATLTDALLATLGVIVR